MEGSYPGTGARASDHPGLLSSLAWSTMILYVMTAADTISKRTLWGKDHNDYPQICRDVTSTYFKKKKELLYFLLISI